MLVELAIRDLALFERAELCFGAGLNVTTGATGAGKSLLIGALELILGQHPRAEMVRRGAANAVVEGRFVFLPGSAPSRLLEGLRHLAPAVLEDQEADGELELVISRTITADGRTRAHLNQRPVTRRLVREIGGLLVEIHGQNDHQKLLELGEQRRLLDSFGGLEAKVAEYRSRREQWIELGRQLDAWADEESSRRDRLDLLRFQRSELEAAELSVEEVEELRRERERLRHAAELLQEIGGALGALADGDDSALDVLRRSELLLDRWEGKVRELALPAGELRDASAHLEQATASLRTFLDGVEYAPERLEEIEERLAEIDRLERKHRCDLAELIALLPRIVAELEELESRSTDFEGCRAEHDRARAALEESAERLTRARRRLRGRLKRAVEASLAELGLEGARFEVAVEPRERAPSGSSREPLESANADPGGPLPDPEEPRREADLRRFGTDGADDVELLLAANPGEGLGPLRRVASGGEAARIMLALRGALAARQSIPTLIFDEVDAGIGGRLAPKVGAHLRELAKHYQILCITHLPAVAASAHTHLEVEKGAEGKRTVTRVRELDATERIEVIADMIAGGKRQKTARAEAERLLKSASSS